jgi:hypothetical protein
MTRNRALAYLAALLLLSGAEGSCGSDSTSPSGPDPFPAPPAGQQPAPPADGGGAPAPTVKPGDPEPDDMRMIYVRTGVPEEDKRPYEVEIYAPGATPSNIKELVVGSTFNHTLKYKKGTEVQVRVEVKPSRAGSQAGFCSIESGNKHDGPRFIAGGWRANCWLTVK